VNPAKRVNALEAAAFAPAAEKNRPGGDNPVAAVPETVVFRRGNRWEEGATTP
jgi:hypothetical protein